MDVDEFHRRLGRAIATRRKAARMTQEGLAERVDSSPEWLSQVERGVGVPSMALVFRIGDALGVPGGVLLGACLEPEGQSAEVAELHQLVERLSDGARRVLLATGRALDETGARVAEDVPGSGG